MQVFISWSGERSRKLAAIVRGWLPIVVRKVRSWASDEIECARRWQPVLSIRLAESHFGIGCVTPENATAPWLLFEAGALSKSVENDRFVPLLFGMASKDLPPPLSQFQALHVTKEHLLRLALSISEASSPSGAERDAVTHACEIAWPWVESQIGMIPTTPVPVPAPHPVSEVVDSVAIPAQLRCTNDESLPHPGREASDDFIEVLRRELTATKQALLGYDSLLRFYERMEGGTISPLLNEQYSVLRYKRAALQDVLSTLSRLEGMHDEPSRKDS
jgi:hypothetical protein